MSSVDIPQFLSRFWFLWAVLIDKSRRKKTQTSMRTKADLSRANLENSDVTTSPWQIFKSARFFDLSMAQSTDLWTDAPVCYHGYNMTLENSTFTITCNISVILFWVTALCCVLCSRCISITAAYQRTRSPMLTVQERNIALNNFCSSYPHMTMR